MEIDGEEHRKWRRLLDPLFAPKQVIRLENSVRELAAELIDKFAESGKADLAEQFCVPLPCLTFLRLLGAPVEDLDFFLEFKQGVIHPQGDTLEEVNANMAVAGGKLLEYFAAFLAKRREETEQADDIISALLFAEVEGQPLNDLELLNILFLLMFAGLDTVTSSMSCTFAWLAQHPEERQRLVDDPSLIPAAIEEIMRFESPVPGGMRYSDKEDIDLGDGLVIKKGQAIHAVWATANVDPNAFPDPLTVDFGRRPSHIVFASGTHRCLGSHLARLEMRLAVEEFLKRIPDYSVQQGEHLDLRQHRGPQRDLPAHRLPAEGRRTGLTGSRCSPLPADLRQHYLDEGLWDDTSLGSLLVDGLRATPHQTVRVWSKVAPRALTFGELELVARRCASGFRAMGVRQGDRVVYQLPNCIEAAATYLGLTMLGAILVPVAGYYGRKELIDIVNQTGASVLVTMAVHGNRDYLAELRDSRAAMPGLVNIVLCGGTTASDAIAFDDLLKHPPLTSLAVVDPDSACMYGFTSGTSGRSKGVIQTHRSLVAEVRHHLAVAIPRGDAPKIVATPIAHAAGMTMGVLGPISRGEPINYADTFDIDFILDVCRREGLAPGGGAAVFLSALIDHPDFTDEIAENMRHVVLGGSIVPEALVRKAARRGVTVLRSYGSTEQPTISCAMPDDDPEKLATTDGKPAARCRGGRQTPGRFGGALGHRRRDLQPRTGQVCGLPRRG